MGDARPEEGWEGFKVKAIAVDYAPRKRAKAVRSEALIKADCLALVLAMRKFGLPVGVYKTMGTAATRTGEPDLHLSVAGRFVAVELKRRGEKPTKLQGIRLKYWSEAGATATWTDCAVGLHAIIVGVLDGAGYNHRPWLAFWQGKLLRKFSR
jgi:hypothetical protein